MEKPVSRRAFVAAAGSAAAAAAGLAAWKASRPNLVPAGAPAEVAAGAATPARTALVDVDGWLLTSDDVDSLPDRTTWVVETQ